MLRILGSRRSFCDRVPRREFLQAGGISLFGLGLDKLLRADEPPRSAGREPQFGRAKSCILLYLYGSPSQLETFGVKPDAPLEVPGGLVTLPAAHPRFPIVAPL